MKTALLVLEDGNQFYGQSVGAVGEACGEMVFNTSVTGYQEIITDPSYSKQIVIFTYPHIGNVGINESDSESDRVQLSGIVIRNLSNISSNFRHTLSLSNYLIQQNVIGISNIDTRQLTRLIRKKGTQYSYIYADHINKIDIKSVLYKAERFFKTCRSKLSYSVSTDKKYIWNQGTFNINSGLFNYSKNLPYRVVVYDFGVKRNLMRILVDYGCLLTVVPSCINVQEIIDMNPDGIFLTNGPGDPSIYNSIIDSVRLLLETTNIPLFGICLGHQLLALASGAKTVKMKFGHHGANHPVKDLNTNKVLITTQNHNFVVDKITLPNVLRITHISLFDQTLQGLHHINKPAFSIQGHPEASPGPHDFMYLFRYFIELIKRYRNL